MDKQTITLPALSHFPDSQPQFQTFSLEKHGESITNWSKTHVIGYKCQVVEISSEQQLIKFIRNSKGKVKPYGSRLSFQPLSQQDRDHTLVDLKLAGIVSQTENTIQVYGGTTLEFLFETVLKKGKMLHDCPGVIAIQTVAGAISTGTHGQGMYQSTIGDSVIELTIVDAVGNLKTVRREDSNFGGYLTALGCLGIITRVKFELEENKIYRCQKFNSSFDYLLNEFQKLTVEKIQTKAWWFPWTDEVQIWHIEEATQEEFKAYGDNNNQLLSISEDDKTLQKTINLVKNKMVRQTKDSQDNQTNLRVLTRFEVITDVVGNIYQIMNKGIPIPQINCQIAVDMVHYKPLLLKLHAWFQEHKHSLHYPFILRPTGKSKAWLSGSYDQVSIHIGYLMYISEDGNFVKGSLDLLKEIESIIAEFGGRPHMGKRFSPELYNFEERYPNWNKFKQLMVEEDSEGRFRNKFLDKLFKLQQPQ